MAERLRGVGPGKRFLRGIHAIVWKNGLAVLPMKTRPVKRSDSDEFAESYPDRQTERVASPFQAR